MGNVYVGGEFEGSLDFDPSTNVDFRTTGCPNFRDHFVWELGPNGDFRWVYKNRCTQQNFTNQGLDSPYDLATDGNGNLYMLGAYKNPTDFESIFWNA